MASNTITIRLADIDEASILSEIGRKTFTETFGHLYSRENLENFLGATYDVDRQREEIADPETHIAFALIGEKIAGFAKSGRCKLPVDNAPAQAYELHRLYVLPDAQRAGAGKALMEDALDYFASRRAQHIYLGVWAENHRAQGFYRKFGFVPVGRYAFMVGDQADDEVIMCRLKQT